MSTVCRTDLNEHITNIAGDLFLKLDFNREVNKEYLQDKLKARDIEIAKVRKFNNKLSLCDFFNLTSKQYNPEQFLQELKLSLGDDL